MTAFQQFRLWARRAPFTERASASVGAALVLAAAGWLVAPATTNGGPHVLPATTAGAGPASAAPPAAGTSALNSGSGRPTSPAGAGLVTSAAGGGSGTGAQTGSGGSGGGPGNGPGTGSASLAGGGASGGDTVGGGAADAVGCVSPSGSDQGVTPGQIKIAILLVNLVGPEGNQAVGVPPADVQQQDYQKVADSINASGGVACRRLVLDFFTDNPVDQSNLQQICLDVTQAHVMMAFDLGGYSAYPALMNCYAENHIPFFAGSSMSEDQLHPYYPYMFTANDMDILYHNTAFALARRGFFNPGTGFRKLGYLYRDCDPNTPSEFTTWLHEAGLSSAQIVAFDEGCPATLLPSPSELEQAVLTFQERGVTNVTETQGDFNDFTKIAQQQGFRPKYGIPDDDVIFMAYGSDPPDARNSAGTIAISQMRFGEERTPGFTPTGGTVRCNAIMSASGLAPVYQQELGMGGVACDQLWTFQDMVDHAPALLRTALASGLQAVGSIDYSYPYGPNDFRGQRVTYGGQEWRAAEFFSSCACWRVIDATFHAPFP